MLEHRDEGHSTPRARGFGEGDLSTVLLRAGAKDGGAPEGGVVLEADAGVVVARGLGESGDIVQRVSGRQADVDRGNIGIGGSAKDLIEQVGF